MATQAHISQPRELAERAFSDILDGHDIDCIPEYYRADCRFYGMTGPEAIDRDEYAAFLSMYFEAFPDLSFNIDEILVEDDTVAVRWTSHGTHENDLMDTPATGKTATVSGISMLHVENGEITEVHNSMDMLGLLQQLDAIPDSPRKIVRLLIGQMRNRIRAR